MTLVMKKFSTLRELDRCRIPGVHFARLADD